MRAIYTRRVKRGLRPRSRVKTTVPQVIRNAGFACGVAFELSKSGFFYRRFNFLERIAPLFYKRVGSLPTVRIVCPGKPDQLRTGAPLRRVIPAAHEADRILIAIVRPRAEIERIRLFEVHIENKRRFRFQYVSYAAKCGTQVTVR